MLSALHGPSSGNRRVARRGKKPISPCWQEHAFTLLELLAVIAIMVLVASLAIPAISGSKGAADVNKAVYDVAGTLEQARAYAITNNTYVWVGIAEVDQSQNSSASAQATGYGRLALAAIASKDGTKIYDETASDIGTDWAAKTASGTGLIQIGKLVRLENTHLADSLGVPTSGKMQRPAVSSPYRLGNASCASVLSFTYPLGKAASSVQYVFTKVIQFDSQGTAKIIMKSNYDTIIEWMEIGLQQMKGTSPPPTPANPNVGNHIALQLDGLTGALKIYRP